MLTARRAWSPCSIFGGRPRIEQMTHVGHSTPVVGRPWCRRTITCGLALPRVSRLGEATLQSRPAHGIQWHGVGSPAQSNCSIACLDVVGPQQPYLSPLECRARWRGRTWPRGVSAGCRCSIDRTGSAVRVIVSVRPRNPRYRLVVTPRVGSTRTIRRLREPKELALARSDVSLPGLFG